MSYGLAQGTELGITGVWIGRALANLPIIEVIHHEAAALRRMWIGHMMEMEP